MPRIKSKRFLFSNDNMMTKDKPQGTNHTPRVKHKTINLIRNIAIALILLALLIRGIIAYYESGAGQPKATI